MKYELLANALESRFGNIYEYNLDGGDSGFDVQPWTDDLKTAVRDYLLHDLPDDVARCWFVTEMGVLLVDNTLQETDIDEILARNEPWEVALSVRYAAVRAVPTLDELIGHQENWHSEDDRTDAAVWLDAHPVQDLWEDLATASRYVERLSAVGMPSRRHDPDTWDLVEVLTPQELLAAWRDVVGLAPSDLTDAEWALLVPFLPAGARTSPMTERRLVLARRRLNGLRFRYEHGTSWRAVPKRYGTIQAFMVRSADYKKRGVFARALESLDGNPDAARLMEWLGAAEKGISRRSRKPS
jgi:transposase